MSRRAKSFEVERQLVSVLSETTPFDETAQLSLDENDPACSVATICILMSPHDSYALNDTHARSPCRMEHVEPF